MSGNRSMIVVMFSTLRQRHNPLTRLSMLALILLGVWAALPAPGRLATLNTLITPASAKSGYVAARGLVRGANGQPIFVELNAQGQQVSEIGEASGEREGAYVMSADDYRRIVAAYAEVMARPEARGAVVKTRNQYLTTDLGSVTVTRTDGGTETVAVPKPGLDSSTQSVVLRNNRTIVDPALLPADGPILYRAPIDLRNGVRHNLDNNIRAVLIGKLGQVLKESANAIGYKSQWFAERGDPAGSLPSRKPGETFLAPIPQAYVEEGLYGLSNYTDANGMYSFMDPLVICPSNLDTTLRARLSYRNFDPEASNPTQYYWFQRRDFIPCKPIYTPLTAGTYTSFAAPNAGSDFYIDVMMFNGEGFVSNDGNSSLEIGAQTRYQAAPSPFVPSPPPYLDLDADSRSDWTVLKQDNTVDVYLAGNYPASTDPNTGQSYDAAGNAISPNLTRLADTPPDFSDQGLLQTLSEDDLAQTDIYFYRVVNGQLIAKLTELGQKRIFRDAKQFTYRQLVPGPEGTLNDPSAAFIFRDRLGQWQEQLGLAPEFRGFEVNHLRPGEQVKIIAVNRPTGYMGSAVTTLQNPTFDPNVDPTGAKLDFAIPALVLRPPNLKIKVERVYQVDAGLTRGDTPKRQIGFEGSALTSDLRIELSTEWFDHDGSALPESLEGYTGRLAKVTDTNSLEGGDVATFGIHPGKHLQVLSFRGDYLGSEHMYVHVFGTPEWEVIDGAGSGPLQYRPDHYVPVKVPIFDEVTTRRLRNSAAYNGQSAASVAPVYQWPYRPEMQFSVMEFAVQGLQVQDSNGQSHLIDLSSGLQADLVEQLMADSDSAVEFLYDLLDPDFNPLPNLGPEREMVLALGAEEVRAVIMPNGQVVFDDLSHLDKLSVSDMFSIRLLQNSDAANVLWEYAFPYLDVAVDLNRDGKVDFDKEQKSQTVREDTTLAYKDRKPTDKTSPALPYRFWINNDLDVVNSEGNIEWTWSDCEKKPTQVTAEGQYQQVCEQWDENPATETNTSANRLTKIESYRDLEDFAPLAIRLGNTDFGDHYSLRLKAVGVGINLFRGTWRYDGQHVAHAYIHNNDETKRQVEAANKQGGHVINVPAGVTVVIPPTKISDYFGIDGIGRFIFEGTSASSSACTTNAQNCYLSVMIYDNEQSQPLVERKVYLDLHNIKDFYVKATAGSADVDPTLPNNLKASYNAQYTGADISPLPYTPLNIYKGLEPTQTYQKDFTLFVHGWRMRDYEITSFIDTGFKRLYWSGYKGAYGGISWPTGWFDLPAHVYERDISFFINYMLGNELNYDRSEAVARQTGPLLAKWLRELKKSAKNIHVIAHSMGNVVVSEALRSELPADSNTPAPPSLITSYSASMAATAAGGFDQSALYLNHRLLFPSLTGCDNTNGTPVQLGPEDSWRCYNAAKYGIDYDMPPDLYRSTFNFNTAGTRIEHGHTTDIAMSTAVGASYYSGINLMTDRLLNYWNDTDAALNVWEFNQLTKPDNLGVGDWEYHNEARDAQQAYQACLQSGSLVCVPPPTYTGQVTSRFTYELINTTELFWSKTLTQDSAQILAHIVPARTNALGQTVTTGLIPLSNNFETNYTNSNQDHSAPFHGYYAQPNWKKGNTSSVRAMYWNTVLEESVLLREQRDEYSELKNSLGVIQGNQ